MKIVIDIPKEMIEAAKTDMWCGSPTVGDAIRHGTPYKEIPQWISCSERLPEEDGQYLITVKYKHVNDSYEDVFAEHGEWVDGKWDMFCFGHCGEVEDIIAWMPLPEPYEKEGDRNE